MSSAAPLLVSLLLGQAPETPAQFIDRHFQSHWKAEKITPAEAASDDAFLRRVCLDLIGRVPTSAEREAFLKDPAEKRRALLVDRLLDDPDYARHWANLWTDWLLGTHDDPTAKLELHEWLRRHFAKGGSHSLLAESLLTATGNTRDNPAVHWFVAHRGQQFIQKDWRLHGQYDMVPLTGLACRLFLGTRVQCVQCHDHPFSAELRQEHFHRLSGLFRQVAFRATFVGTERRFEISDEPKLNERAIMFHERRNGVVTFTTPQFFDGAVWDNKLKQTRREFFADQLVRRAEFSRAAVQRIWDCLFHQGLSQNDADDMCEGNAIVHPELLDRLAREFVKSGHDPKTLLRIICTSEVYGLSSVGNATNLGPDKAVHFGVHPVRPLSPEQLVDSLVVVLRPDLSRAQRVALARAWRSEFRAGPRPEPNHCEAELLGRPEVSDAQMLWLTNSKTIHAALTEDNAIVTAALREKNIETAIDRIFLQALGRPPSAKESKSLSSAAAAKLAKKVDLSRDDVRRAYYEDVLWSLLNSAEFATNH